MEDQVKVISLTAIIPADEDPQDITELAELCTSAGDQLPRKGYVSIKGGKLMSWSDESISACEVFHIYGDAPQR